METVITTIDLREAQKLGPLFLQFSNENDQVLKDGYLDFLNENSADLKEKDVTYPAFVFSLFLIELEDL